MLLIVFVYISGSKERNNSLLANNDIIAGQEPPNIILILSDDQAWNDYSFMGHDHIETPRIDQLASEGLTFTYGYSPAPLCSPALASFVTGLYPHQHGILGNDPVFTSNQQRYSTEWRVERSEFYEPYIADLLKSPTIPSLLKNQGYVSLQVGKWWLGNYRNGGFDQGMTHGDPARGGRHGDDGLTIGREGLDLVYDFINDATAKDAPFFVWYAPFLPHAPHNPPDSLKQKYLPLAPTEAVANYWAMCEWFDITCGQLMDYVQSKGISKETLFVYVTDNGWIQDPDNPNRFAPRSKQQPYEGGIRTPMMFRWLDTIAPEMDTTTAVSGVDIAATILGITQINQPEEMQGINVLDRDALKARDLIFSEAYAHDFTTVDSSLYYRVAIDFPYKLILPDERNKPEAKPELFNIQNDPFETDELSDSHTDQVSALKTKTESWWISR
jgi:arylsulfatase A-like enzyme